MSRHRIVTAHRLAVLHRQLTPADRAVLAILDRLRVVTGLQLQALHHGVGDAAKQRRIRQLARLTRLQVITPLARRIGGVERGSISTVYTLDVAGRRLLHPECPARAPWTPSTPFVAHALAVSELFVQLVLAERASRLELIGFDAEPRCWRRYRTPTGELATIKPDADVVVGVGEFEHHLLVEVDLGTESRPTITRKAEAYVDYFATGSAQAERGVTPLVVFTVPDDARRSAVADALHRLPAESWRFFAVYLAPEFVDRVCALGVDE